MGVEAFDYRVAARLVYDAIDQSPPGWDNFWPNHPAWVGRVVASLIIAVGSEEISFVSVGMASDAAHRVAVVVGQTIVAEALVSTADDEDHVEFAVTARSLLDLEELGVAADVSPVDTSGWTAWPGRPSLRLSFRSGAVVEVPVASVRRPDDRARLTALAERLPGFLGGKSVR